MKIINEEENSVYEVPEREWERVVVGSVRKKT